MLDGGAQFALFSRHASAVTLVLFEDGAATQPAAEFRLCREEHRTGDIWHGLVEGVGAGWCYLYRVDGPFAPDEGHRFDPARPLFDRDLSTLLHWHSTLLTSLGTLLTTRGRVV